MISTDKNNNIFGVFDEEDIFLEAMKKIKSAGIKIKNVFTPYPIHEVFHEMGLKTRMPYAAFIYGVFGISLTYAFLYWTSVIDIPIVIGGKPNNTLSFIIILFVMTINVGIVLSLGTFFIRQKLGPGKEAVVVHNDITDDKFVIVIEKPEDMSKEETNRINSVLFENGAIETGEKENIENI
ncbi:MAG: DUF3341 domain-containing protein [Bacteroidetes bacterium]|mgnify:CR=1 FL=1|jgi:hypothetical protein|nr:DUF3341 domain-containing protein [Bacteroidota bacterium]MBT6687850.1 DUF3341 domain-containing protein [Bacteroidota bacterium]MBT7142082.1 DUF3341 domain-containing protein [Bacteroidota bacterium]MBT7492353.1 DUF3341 domain-containing protein [Bacteroidota bacterium]